MFGDTPLPGWRTWAVLVFVIMIGVIGLLAYETLTFRLATGTLNPDLASRIRKSYHPVLC